MSFYPVVSKLAKATSRLLPDLDPPYTQLTSDQIAEIHSIKKDLFSIAEVEVKDSDYEFTDTVNYAATDGQKVNLKVPRMAEWFITDDPYLTRIYHHYGTLSLEKKVTGFDATFPNNVFVTIKFILIDTDNNGARSVADFYEYIQPKSVPATKYKSTDAVSYNENQDDGNTIAINDNVLIRTIFWNRDIQMIYEVFDNTGKRIIDKRFTTNVKMHVTIFKNNNTQKPTRHYSVHASTLGEEDFITLDQTDHIGSIITQTNVPT